FRFHIDPATSALWVTDVGENTYEEVDRLPAGGLDLGWPFYEGPQPHLACPGPVPILTDPVYWYDRTTYASAAGMSAGVYRLPLDPNGSWGAGYDGDYFFSDYYVGFLRRLHWDGSA